MVRTRRWGAAGPGGHFDGTYRIAERARLGVDRKSGEARFCKVYCSLARHGLARRPIRTHTGPEHALGPLVSPRAATALVSRVKPPNGLSTGPAPVRTGQRRAGTQPVWGWTPCGEHTTRTPAGVGYTGARALPLAATVIAAKAVSPIRPGTSSRIRRRLRLDVCVVDKLRPPGSPRRSISTESFGGAQQRSRDARAASTGMRSH